MRNFKVINIIVSLILLSFCSYNKFLTGISFEVFPLYSMAPSHINLMFIVNKNNLPEDIQENIKGTMRIDIYLYWAQLVPSSMPLEMEKILGWIPIDTASFMINEFELEKGFFNEFYVKDPGMYKLQLVLVNSEGVKIFVSDRVFRVSDNLRNF